MLSILVTRTGWVFSASSSPVTGSPVSGQVDATSSLPATCCEAGFSASEGSRPPPQPTSSRLVDGDEGGGQLGTAHEDAPFVKLL